MNIVTQVVLSIAAMIAMIFTLGLIIFGISDGFADATGGEALSFGTSVFVSAILWSLVGTIWYMKGKANA